MQLLPFYYTVLSGIVHSRIAVFRQSQTFRLPRVQTSCDPALLRDPRLPFFVLT